MIHFPDQDDATSVVPIERAPNWRGKWFAIIPGAAVFDPNLTDGEFRTLAALAAYASGERLTTPAQATIAARLGYLRTSVCRAIRKIQRRGYLELVKRTRKTNGGHGPNVYRIAGFERRTEASQPPKDANVDDNVPHPTSEHSIRSSTHQNSFKRDVAG